MEQGRDSHGERLHETIERDAYATYDRLAEGIELSATDQARVDRAVRSVREDGYAIVTGFLDGERTRRVREELAAVFDLPDDLVIKGKRLPAGGGEYRPFPRLPWPSGTGRRSPIPGGSRPWSSRRRAPGWPRSP